MDRLGGIRYTEYLLYITADLKMYFLKHDNSHIVGVFLYLVGGGEDGDIGRMKYRTHPQTNTRPKHTNIHSKHVRRDVDHEKQEIRLD